MALRRSAGVFLFLAASCYVVPAPQPPQAAADVEQARAMYESQVQILSAMLVQRVTDPACGEVESAGMTELAARVATLNDRLEELLTRLPAPSTAPRAAEASSSRDDADTVGIEMLRQALGVIEQQRNLCFENLGNVHTTGYKKRQMSVSTALLPGTGMQVPSVADIQMVCTAGTLELSERQLDVAIDGDGWFVVVAGDGGTRYTRDGNLHVGADGAIVTSEGQALCPRVVVPEDALEISIDPTGKVTARTASRPDEQATLGEIQLARVADPGRLEAMGKNTYRLRDAGQPGAGRAACAAPGSPGVGWLKQGFLERSNVQTLDELVNLQVVDRQRTALRRALASCGVFVR